MLTTDLGPITVLVRFTPAAAKRLTDLNEGVLANASWMADPTNAGRAHTNEIGTVSLGAEQQLVTGGRAVITSHGVRRQALRWTRPGTVNLNINIWSARRSGPNNILACTIYDGPAVPMAGKSVHLRCGLIGEGDSDR